MLMILKKNHKRDPRDNPFYLNYGLLQTWDWKKTKVLSWFRIQVVLKLCPPTGFQLTSVLVYQLPWLFSSLLKKKK